MPRSPAAQHHPQYDLHEPHGNQAYGSGHDGKQSSTLSSGHGSPFLVPNPFEQGRSSALFDVQPSRPPSPGQQRQHHPEPSGWDEHRPSPAEYGLATPPVTSQEPSSLFEHADMMVETSFSFPPPQAQQGVRPSSPSTRSGPGHPAAHPSALTHAPSELDDLILGGGGGGGGGSGSGTAAASWMDPAPAPAWGAVGPASPRPASPSAARAPSKSPSGNFWDQQTAPPAPEMGHTSVYAFDQEGRPELHTRQSGTPYPGAGEANAPHPHAHGQHPRYPRYPQQQQQQLEQEQAPSSLPWDAYGAQPLEAQGAYDGAYDAQQAGKGSDWGRRVRLCSLGS
jgi:hypothetical protein